MADRKQLPDEVKNDLQKIANDNDVTLISFIAPDTIIRKSPIAYDYAQIKIQDLYNLEEILEGLKSEGKLTKKLHLIIHTPGGRADASAKIAKYLQDTFEEIDAFVPYEASSGGTLLCLAAGSIVMSPVSNLTPIDPQVPYKGGRISATSYEQVVEEMEEKYSTFSPEEIPSPYQQLFDKLDPIIYKEMKKLVTDTVFLAFELLEKSQKPANEEERTRLIRIAFSLGKTSYPHSHIFDIKESKDIGLNISDDTNKINLLKTYKKWVSCRLTEPETSHIIDFFTPEGSANGKEKTAKSAETKKQEDS